MSEIKIDELIRCRRKSIGLMITQDARLIVRAPNLASDAYIRKLVQEKSSWIVRKQEHFRKYSANISKRQFIPGEKFYYLGNEYLLIAVDDLPKAIVFDGNLKISSMVLVNAKDHLESWYKQQAYEYISTKAQELAQIHGLFYKSLRINDAQGRWGSCGYRDTLNFTWRLIMAPTRVIDYVIVHELMHLKQKNHGRKFWAEVAQIIPDYKQDEEWFKQYSHLLVWKA